MVRRVKQAGLLLSPFGQLTYSCHLQMKYILVRETSEDGWLHGRLERTGEEGLFPDNYVELIRVEVNAMLPS